MSTHSTLCHARRPTVGRHGNSSHVIDPALRRERLAELVSELSEVPLATARIAIPDAPADEDPLCLVAAALVRLRAARSETTLRRQGHAAVF